MLSPDVLAAYAAFVATIVSALISQFIKPLVEALPAFSPNAADKRPHDAMLRLANVLLNVLGVALMASANGYLTLANWQTLAIQIIGQVAWSHGVYQTAKPPQAASPAAPVPAEPLHQSAILTPSAADTASAI